KTAIELYTETNVAFEQLNDTIYWLRSLNSIGLIHNLEENNSESLKFLTQGILIANQVRNPCYDVLHQKLMILTNILNVYNRTNDFEKSIKLSNEAIEIALQISDSTRLGNIYNALGISYRKMDQTDKAISYYEKAGKIFNQLNDQFTYSFVLNNIASLYEHGNNIDSALYYYTLANNGFKAENYPFGIAKSEYGLAAIYAIDNNKQKAQQHFENALKTASEHNFNDILIDVLFDLSEFEYNNQNYKKAYQLTKQYISLNDSIYSIEKEKEIANLKSKYELSIIENELNTLKSESLKQTYNISLKIRQFQIALIFIVFLIAIVATIFIYYRQKNKANKLLAEKNIQIEKQNDKLIIVNAEIEKANKKLQQSRHELMLSNQLKDRFFSILAHDLQNPFHHVIGFSKLLSDYYDKLSAEERRNMANDIHQSTTN
ncbi:MAG TPA: tetratricopeptide repeat protein, partial [Prolixibacteraceae bacterium]|nr:tetratricopeptide repeat protein [Prolixibacteraceae bacterium]